MIIQKNIARLFVIFCTYTAIHAAPVAVPFADRMNVLNEFRAIMKGVDTIEAYIDQLSDITVPLIGDPNAKPAIEGEIAKQQQAINTSFAPILHGLDVLTKIELEQPWLLELVCLEGGAPIRQDVVDIKHIVDTSLQTLQENFNAIHQLANSLEIKQLKTTIETNDSVKNAVILMAQEHPVVKEIVKKAVAPAQQK